MGRRTIAILIFIVGILALAVVGIIYLRQQDQPPAADTATGEPTGEEAAPGAEAPGAEAPGLEAAATLPPTNQVVVSLQTVPRGWQITEAELTYDERLVDEIDSNVITNIEDAVGLYARTDIFQGETLTKDSLVDDPTLIGNGYGPSSLIPPGFVAMAVPMDRLSGVAYALSAGDTIDIMLSFVFREVDPEFQTLLHNSATFPVEVVHESETEGGETETTISFLVVDPLGRFETLPNEDLAHITANGDGRPIPVSMILQNAKVIQVGEWEPVPPVQIATPTPPPAEGAEPTPAPGGPTPQVTPTLPTPSVILVALSPQQQLFLKYAVESAADIDFALRGENDGQLYSVENVSLEYLLQRFNIEIPIPVDYTLGGISVTATPAANEGTSGEVSPDES
jgi:Flp pilus assembly protein CpaB